MRRAFSLVVALLVTLTACVGGDERATPDDVTKSADPTSTPAGLPPGPTQPALVQSVDRDCRPWSGEPREAQITFAKRGRLFALSPGLDEARCIGRRSSSAFEWGPRGDRIVLTSGGEVAYGDSFEDPLAGEEREVTWSRPSGTSVVYIGHDYRSLYKEDVETGRIVDISFLDSFSDVVYHPAGTHIAVSGVRNGRMGVFLATNVGTQVQQIVRGEHAESIDHLTFSQDGRRLYFHADHGARHDLHVVRILTGEESANTKEALWAGALRTLYRGPKVPDFVVSPFSRRPRLAFTDRCREQDAGGAWTIERGQEQQVGRGLEPISPVGWLPDHSLVMLAFSRRCDDFGDGDLYLWRDGEATLLVENVQAAAVRATLPDPPDPPARAQEVVA